MQECRLQNPHTKFPLEKTGLWGEVVRQRKPIVENDFQAPNRLKKGYPEGHVPISRFMSIPIQYNGKIVAVVGLANKPADYTDNDLYNITILMGGAWHAVQNRDTQEQLAYERNKYLQTLISIGDGVMVVDRAGKIEILNDVAQELTGWTKAEAAGRHYKEVFVLTGEYPGSLVTDPIEAVFETNMIQELGNHTLLISKNGARYYLEDSAGPIFNESGENVGAVLVFRNVTEKNEQRRKIEYLSFHDTLTGLYNRRYFEEELRRIDAERNLPISIIMGDVNGLKLTNDVFGHSYGDMLLVTIANILRSACRVDDIVARWGGDEYIILLPKTDRPEAEGIVARINTQCSHVSIKSIRCSISMGIDTKSSVGEGITDILKNAEKNMYLEKTLERDAVKEEELDTVVQTLHEAGAEEKGHAEHVGRLCEKLGRELRLSENDVCLLRQAGFLHDVGKVVLEPKLLDAKRPLFGEEMNEVKKHPVVGFRILNSWEKTLGLAEAVLAHHECWDGSGYPKGLNGEEIPLLARIIAVADSYDRIARGCGGDQAGSMLHAMEIIRSRSGTKYDPRIADVFLRLLESDEELGTMK
jgi:diguanylate cyclase (GGDEF)-like protein/PAS domain S-box-containing protein